MAWWSVDLLVRTKIHMIRIVTAVGYKKSDFEGLELRVGRHSFLPTSFSGFLLVAQEYERILRKRLSYLIVLCACIKTLIIHTKLK